MRSRLLWVAAASILSVAVHADPIKYTVYESKAKVGTLTAETTGDDDSGYVDDSSLTMTKEGTTATIHEVVHYGKDGVATSRSMEMTSGEQSLKLKAALSDDGAKISIWLGDQKDEKEVKLASKTSRADASNFWFKRSKPEVGTSVTYQAFDLQEATWSDVTLKYVGKVKIKIGDQELEENEIDRTEGETSSKIFVDDKGDAVVIEDGEMRIERQL